MIARIWLILPDPNLTNRQISDVVVWLTRMAIGGMWYGRALDRSDSDIVMVYALVVFSALSRPGKTKFATSTMKVSPCVR